MADAVNFVYADWIAMFPEFAAVPEPTAKGYFARAALYCVNSETNPAFPDNTLPTLLYLVTAHIAQLYSARDALGNAAASGQPAPNLVGQLTSASEGSVSVSVAPVGGDVAAWFAQTRYGLDFWQATAQYRTMHYVTRPFFVGPTRRVW
jgi:hypothetical protein